MIQETMPVDKLETRCLSSLTKVLPDLELTDAPVFAGSALNNETYSFQIAYRALNVVKPIKKIKVRIESELGSAVSVRKVGLVPSELPCYSNHDEHVLRGKPGLYPDPLYAMGEQDFIAAVALQWRAIWITVELHNQIVPGRYPINVQFESNEGDWRCEERFELNVLPAMLPAQQLKHTEWFHSDCIATYYETEVFSEKHWQLIGQFVETAVKHGINMLLTPVFTPPLDTEVGGERPTVQLVDVFCDGKDKYRFGFERLRRWVELCESAGVRYYEISHLFTQWGAEHAPKIIGTFPDGTTARIFGWETDAGGEAYAGFLAQFIPELIAFIRENGLEERCFFHVSDEPRRIHLDSYRIASETLRKHLQGFTVIDALSNFDFYEQGLVTHPVPSNNHLAPFLEAGIPDLWTYYCCSQSNKVSNRFFDMPSVRNRILGFQLYKYKMGGFLHWGYNFWYSQRSVRPIDPFQVTDADLAFPSGDAFLVYPGENGPIESIRLEVFYEGLQDLRSLQLLESLIGRDQTLQLLEEGLELELTFEDYPMDAEWLLERRERINRAIHEHLRFKSSEAK